MSHNEKPEQDCILVIDDEANVLGLVRATLEDAGYVVFAASNANEGVEFYQNHWQEIKVVVLDFLMPEMTGDVVLQWMQLVNPNVKVLLLTAYGREVVSRMRALGVCGYLNKPFSLPDLVQRVQDAISTPTVVSSASPVALDGPPVVVKSMAV
jgi:two-component system response regulator (stage 0 sporulation protein F)